jgi:hypothetical protein
MMSFDADREDDEGIVPAEEPAAPTEEPLVLPGSTPLPVTSDPQVPARSDDPLQPDVPAYPEPEPMPDPAPSWLRP